MNKLIESFHSQNRVDVVTHNGDKVTGYITEMETTCNDFVRDASICIRIIGYTHNTGRTLNRKALIL